MAVINYISKKTSTSTGSPMMFLEILRHGELTPSNVAAIRDAWKNSYCGVGNSFSLATIDGDYLAVSGCEYCGTKNKPDNSRCESCGAPL